MANSISSPTNILLYNVCLLMCKYYPYLCTINIVCPVPTHILNMYQLWHCLVQITEYVYYSAIHMHILGIIQCRRVGLFWSCLSTVDNCQVILNTFNMRT